jgi:hypothetical protein
MVQETEPPLHFGHPSEQENQVSTVNGNRV